MIVSANSHRTQENPTFSVKFVVKFMSELALWEKGGAEPSYPGKYLLKPVGCLGWGGGGMFEHPRTPSVSAPVN